VQSREHVAREIVALAARPRRQRHVPRVAALGLMAHAVWPRTTERLLRRALLRFHLGGPQPPTDGGLFDPSPGPGSTRGTRPPLVSGARFALWIIRELAAMAVAGAAGTMQSRQVSQGRQGGQMTPAVRHS
jgi:hypothetical protein